MTKIAKTTSKVKRMNWTTNTLLTHLKQLQQRHALPKNLLLISDDSRLGHHLLRNLLELKTTAAVAFQPEILLLPFVADYQAQKQQLANLIDWAQMASPAPYRFFYIADLHRYSPLFGNRLLKFLDESPVQLIGLFQTYQPAKLLPTLHSRFQSFVLTTPPTKVDLHGNQTELIQQVYRLVQQRAWDQLLFLWTNDATNQSFWQWFSVFLFDLKHQVLQHNQAICRMSFTAALQVINYGWQLLVANQRLKLVQHNQLVGIANWILFVKYWQKCLD